MWWNLARMAASVYGVLFLTAIGGLVIANVSGLIAPFVVENNTSEFVKPWIHGGWCVGTVVAFFGAVTGRLRFLNGTSFGSGNGMSAGETDNSPGEADPPADDPTSATADSVKPEESRQSGIASSVAFFGLIGGILGAVFGCSLLAFWFSLAYSPFSVEEWVSSISVTTEHINPTRTGQAVMTSSHPVVLYLAGVPAAVGATAGMLVGGVGAAFGKVTDG